MEQDKNIIVEEIKQRIQQLLHEKKEAVSFLETFSLCDRIAKLEKLIAYYTNKN